MTTRVRVYIACSLDGFIAGPDDDLSWLPGANGTAPEGATSNGALGYEAFMADVGAILMGRKTYAVARGFEGPWPYGDTPVLIVTHRPLDPDAPAAVRAIDGNVDDVVAAARAAAGDKDVYLDGGSLIRQALDAGLVDELVVTQVPVVLGAGASLFAGTTKRHAFDVVSHVDYLGLVQLTLRPRR